MSSMHYTYADMLVLGEWCKHIAHAPYKAVPRPMPMPAARTLPRPGGGECGTGFVLWGAMTMTLTPTMTLTLTLLCSPSVSLISIVVAAGARGRSIRACSLEVRLDALTSRGAVLRGMLWVGGESRDAVIWGELGTINGLFG